MFSITENVIKRKRYLENFAAPGGEGETVDTPSLYKTYRNAKYLSTFICIV